MRKGRKRLPVNSDTILFDYSETIHRYTKEHFAWKVITGVCTDDVCRNKDEHIRFDGQIFFQLRGEH